MADTTVAQAGVIKTRRPRGFLLDLLVRLVREKPLGAFGGVIFLALLITGVFADFIAIDKVNEIHPIDRFTPPGSEYWLGTDQLGRDIYSRMVYGARLSLIVAFSATTLSIVISVVLGLTTGFFGGRFDMLVQRFVDAWMSFPDLVILIVAVSVLGPGMWQVIFVLGLLLGIAGSRIIRGAVISVRENVYVQATESIGTPAWRVLLKHILPNVMAPIIVLFTTRLAAVILAESGLSFLGLGIPPPAPSWGGMLSIDGRSYMFQAPWLAVIPGIAITVVVYGINIFGDALRDLLDPRMRGGGMSYKGGGVKRRSAK
ncbi:MAG: ABC transporter permease [Betaproteobacteria bacterium]|nr:MAG: ABC transporter permease [Betaproteobacteria bacterium]